MTQHIEDCISETSLPVNTIAMSRRLIEILDESNTNCAFSLKDKNKIKFKKCLWLINSQIYGQMANINMMDEWSELAGIKSKEK